MATEDVVLPVLHPKQRHMTSVPRRYEETRPVTVQQFSHRRIIDLGTELHRQLTQELHKEKVQAQQETEREIWRQSEIVKQEALETQRAELQAAHEKALRKLTKQHERTIKEELIRLTTQMDRLRQDDIAQTKRDAEIKQQEAVRHTEQLCMERQLKAVESARCEEKRAAKQEADDVAEEHERQQRTLRQEMAADREHALKDLSDKLTAERTVAVATAREEEQVSAASRLNHMTELFEKQVGILHGKIGLLQRDVSDMKQQNAAVMKHRVSIQQELLDTRTHFQAFIDLVRPFNHSEAEYVLPPVRTFTEGTISDDS